MTLEDIIGKQPPTVDHAGLEWAIATAIDELRSEKENLEDYTYAGYDEAGPVLDVCNAKILFLEMELDRVQENIRILLDR